MKQYLTIQNFLIAFDFALFFVNYYLIANYFILPYWG